MDANGLRYLISMRSFFILNERASSSVSTPSSPAETPFQTEHRSTAIGRDRLRFRDMVWAFHSESKEILLDASTSACGGKMRWADAKALGVFLWLDTLESMVLCHFFVLFRMLTQSTESAARNHRKK